MKLAMHYIAEPISWLINCSFAAGVFPDILKQSCITPIFKSGDRSMMSNYRPISILPILSKIFEKCMSIRVLNYASKFSILSPRQFGFREGMSTCDAILCYTDYIYKCLNAKHHSLSVFVDLKKAFDTVDHHVLLLKLEHYGIRGLPLLWLSSYLKDRKQSVKIGGSVSPFLETNIAVPQGSILGPILFLFFINDLPNASAMSTILFADDTTLSCSNHSYEVLVNETNSELAGIVDWMKCNKLTINVDKTYCILFSNRRASLSNDDAPLVLDGHALEIVQSGKFLGVTLDNRLSFNLHIDLICNKLSKIVGIFYKLHNLVPVMVLTKLYYSMVYPYLIYCNMAWGGAPKRHIDRLFALQKKIIRLVAGSGYLDHTSPLFYRLRILKLYDIHVYLLALHGFRMSRDGLFTYPDHSHDTRGGRCPAPAFQRLAGSVRSLSTSVPRTWNVLPPNVKACTTFRGFKRALFEFLLEKYIPQGE